jgi:hypothetical protein
MISFEEFIAGLSLEPFTTSKKHHRKFKDETDAMEEYAYKNKMNIKKERSSYIHKMNKFINNNYDEIIRNWKSTILGWQYISSINKSYNSIPNIFCLVERDTFITHSKYTKSGNKIFNKFKRKLIIKCGKHDESFFNKQLVRGIIFAEYNNSIGKWKLLPLKNKEGNDNWFCNYCGCTGINRYVCTVCDNFDICSRCIDKCPHDKSHSLIKYIGNWDEHLYDKSWILCKYDRKIKKFKYSDNILSGIKPLIIGKCDFKEVNTVTI